MLSSTLASLRDNCEVATGRVAKATNHILLIVTDRCCEPASPFFTFKDLEVDDRQTGIVPLLKSDERFQIVSVILP